MRLREGETLDEHCEDRIRRQIRANASPQHVPREILQVADIPRTISGKISEIAVRDVVHGRPVSNTEALANPASPEALRGARRAQGLSDDVCLLIRGVTVPIAESDRQRASTVINAVFSTGTISVTLRSG